MEKILITFLIYKGVHITFKKWGLDEALEWFGAVTNVKFIYEFTKCSFCRNFWLGVLISVFSTFYFGDMMLNFNYFLTLFIYGISCSVLNRIVNSITDYEI